MHQLAINLANSLGPVLADLLAAVVTALLAALVRWVIVRTKADKDGHLAATLDRLQGSVESGVRAGTQRFGDLWQRIAADGVITDAEREELREFGVQLGREAFGPAAIRELEKAIGPDALAAALESYGEAAIQRLREAVGVPIIFDAAEPEAAREYSFRVPGEAAFGAEASSEVDPK